MIGTCARYREAFAGVKKLADAPDFRSAKSSISKDCFSFQFITALRGKSRIFFGFFGSQKRDDRFPLAEHRHRITKSRFLSYSRGDEALRSIINRLARRLHKEIVLTK